MPVLLLGTAVARVGDGVAKVGHPLLVPGVGITGHATG